MSQSRHSTPRSSTFLTCMATVVLIMLAIPLGIALPNNGTKPSDTDPAITMAETVWTATTWYTPPNNGGVYPSDQALLQPPMPPETIPLTLTYKEYCTVTNVSPAGHGITGASCADDANGLRGLRSSLTNQIGAMNGYGQYGPTPSEVTAELSPIKRSTSIVQKTDHGFIHLAGAAILMTRLIGNGGGYAIVKVDPAISDHLPWLHVSPLAPRDDDEVTKAGFDVNLLNTLRSDQYQQYSGMPDASVTGFDYLSNQELSNLETTHAFTRVTGTRTVEGTPTIKTGIDAALFIDGGVVLDRSNRIVGIMGVTYDGKSMTQYIAGTDQLLRDLHDVGFGTWTDIFDIEYWLFANMPTDARLLITTLMSLHPFDNLIAFGAVMGALALIFTSDKRHVHQ